MHVLNKATPTYDELSVYTQLKSCTPEGGFILAHWSVELAIYKLEE